MSKTSGPLFNHLQKRGVFIMLGVLNNEKEFQESVDNYYPLVDAIMTDKP
jgi:hypothetical protein